MERDIGILKEYIVMILSDIIKEKENENHPPFDARMKDVQNTLISDARNAINGLCRDKVLTYHRTLNDVAFEFTPPVR